MLFHSLVTWVIGMRAQFPSLTLTVLLKFYVWLAQFFNSGGNAGTDRRWQKKNEELVIHSIYRIPSFSLLLLSKQFLCISRNTLLRGNTLSHTHRHQATLLHSAILYSKIERLLKVYQNLSSRQEPRGYKQTGGGARGVVLGTTWSNETTTSLIERKLKFWSWPNDYTS